MLIGFVGQGFIGKSYADDFEKRGLSVVRYGLQPEYVGNKENIQKADIVFVAVPAPTVPSGQLRDDGHPAVRFDDANIREAVALAREGAVVVVKSTIPPGTTVQLQSEHPGKIILHSPEFLTESTAAEDAANPERNIVGIPQETPAHRAAAETVLSLLPKAPYTLICPSQDAELIKYGGNAFLFVKIVFANMFYELAAAHGGNWDTIAQAIGADPRIGPGHLGLHLKEDPEGVMNRRGAGRSCFIKDFAELSELYAAAVPGDVAAIQALRGLEYKNAELLRTFNRYLHLLEGVYGPDAGKKK